MGFSINFLLKFLSHFRPFLEHSNKKISHKNISNRNLWSWWTNLFDLACVKVGKIWRNIYIRSTKQTNSKSQIWARAVLFPRFVSLVGRVWATSVTLGGLRVHISPQQQPLNVGSADFSGKKGSASRSVSGSKLPLVSTPLRINLPQRPP